jgi:hypothetical protein
MSFKPVAVGVGAGELAGDLGAEHRRGDHPEVVLDRGEVEAREVVQLDPRGSARHRLEVGRVVGAAGGEADEMLVAPPSLICTTHSRSRGVTRPMVSVSTATAPGRKDARGQVLFVEMYCHWPRAIGDWG